MAKVKTTLQDYRKLDRGALIKRVQEVRKRLQELRSELAIRKLTNHATIRQARKELARLMTILQEKSMLEAIQRDE